MTVKKAPPAYDQNSSHFNQYQQVRSELSKVIIEFALPLLQHCTTYEAREEAVSYAILAWNLSLETETERQAIRNEIEKQFDLEKKEQIQQLFDFLIKRKQALYPDNRFYIVEYDLARQGEKMAIKMETKYLPRGGTSKSIL